MAKPVEQVLLSVEDQPALLVIFGAATFRTHSSQGPKAPAKNTSRFRRGKVVFSGRNDRHRKSPNCRVQRLQIAQQSQHHVERGAGPENRSRVLARLLFYNMTWPYQISRLPHFGLTQRVVQLIRPFIVVLV